MELSRKFFKTVFTDAFIFAADPQPVLAQTNLDPAETRLAMQVWESDLYSEATMQECIDLCQELSDIYSWQDNSEGAWVFASKILFLLRERKRHVSWFRQALRTRKKNGRATLIYANGDQVLLTATRSGEVLLPGGRVEQCELPIITAARELMEETSLAAQHLEFLFEHKSQHYLHSVFVVHSAVGVARAQSDAADLFFYPVYELLNEGGLRNLSRSNREILQRYFNGEGGCIADHLVRY